MIHRLSIAACAALALGLAVPAQAASILMCKPASPGQGSAGPARVTMAGTGNSYQLDRWGCSDITAADVGEATANGFVQTGNVRAIVATGLTAQTQVGVLPPSAYIRDVVVSETNQQAVAGGVKFGSTAGGTDIITGMILAAGGYNMSTDASLAKRIFSSTASTNIWIDANGGWGTSKVNVTVLYSFF